MSRPKNTIRLRWIAVQSLVCAASLRNVHLLEFLVGAALRGSASPGAPRECCLLEDCAPLDGLNAIQMASRW